MAVSKAQQNATNKWIAKVYDRINLTVPKGRKEEIQAFAAQTGESVNGFINRAIGEAMGESPQKPAGAPQGDGAILIHPPRSKRRRRPHRGPGRRFPRSLAVRLRRRRNATRLCKQ